MIVFVNKKTTILNIYKLPFYITNLKLTGMYKHIKIVAFSFVATSSIAQQAQSLYNNYIEAGVNTGLYSSSFTGGVQGAFGKHFYLFEKKSTIDFRAKENYTHKPNRQVGLLSLTFRYFIASNYYIGAGFAHNHEIAIKNYLHEPVKATMGNSKHLIHRTGLVLETGYDFKQVNAKQTFGIIPTLNLAANYLLMDKEPNPYITLSFGIRYGFNPQKILK